MSDGDVEVSRLEVVHGEERVPCLLAEPRSEAPPGGRPGLLVVHDLLGLSDDLEGIAVRLAGAGYVVLAPAYFGEGRLLPCVVRAVRSLRRGRGAPFDRLASAWDRLGALPGVDAGRTGVVGFCLGGGFAVLWAARSDASAVATFYGDVPADAAALEGIPPCVAGYGGRDRVFAHQGRRLRSHLEELGVTHDFEEYPQAGHAYMNRHDHPLMRLSELGPTRGGYDEDAAERSWERMLAFFSTHLGARA